MLLSTTTAPDTPGVLLIIIWAALIALIGGAGVFAPWLAARGGNGRAIAYGNSFAGGVLLADNVLWSGKVADPLVDDEDTQGLRTFNETVKDDPDLASILLPIDDGLMAAVLRAS